MRRWSPSLLLLGAALAGCNPGGNSPSKADQVRPELPRVTVEVKGMT